MLNYKINFKNENYKDHSIFLFFDLLQMSKDILNFTHEDDIIILVGDTPSYLSIFLKGHRKYYHLGFSNKPFGCFYPSFAKPIYDCKFKEMITPNEDSLLKYFKYLDEETDMTKNFIKKNWNKLILIDTSSGASIHGVSIFFNLYVDNIKIKKDENCNLDIDCTNIKGSKPLQFINLMFGMKLFNIDPRLAKKIFKHKKKYNNYNTNFHPKLIIPIATIRFMYREFFTIYESFPRFVPWFDIRVWNSNKPELINSKDLSTLFKIYMFLLKNFNNKEISKHNKDKCFKIIKEMTKNLKNFEQFITDNLLETFHNINSITLINKYVDYFE